MNNKVNKKRILASILAMVCVLLCLPFSAFAAQTVTAVVPIVVNGASTVQWEGNGESGTLEIQDSGELELTFSLLGTYHYTLRQTNEDTADDIYDKTIFDVDVYVTLDNHENMVATVVIYPEGSEEKPKVVEFVNQHKVRPCELDPPLVKLLEGDQPETAGTFRFTMTAVSNTAGLEKNPMPGGVEEQVIVKEIQGPGEYEFGWMTFDRPGIYTYTVKEEEVGEPGYTYDSTQYTLVCTITKEGDEYVGKSEAFSDDKPQPGLIFENQYKKDDSTTPSDPSKPSTPSPVPFTGDTGAILLWGGCGLLALLLVFVLIRKRERHGNQ